VAKLSLGALALNDVWFGGQTMNRGCLKKALPAPVRVPARLPLPGSSPLPSAAKPTAASSVRPCVAASRACAHLWPCRAHGSNDALLVARQTRPHGAHR